MADKVQDDGPTVTEDGGSAFPLPVSVGLDGHEAIAYPGMSLRDWFAGQVLCGFMSVKPMNFQPEHDAEYCYKVADAMIAFRKAGA